MPAADEPPSHALFAAVEQWLWVQGRIVPVSVRLMYVDGSDATLAWRAVRPTTTPDDIPVLTDVLAAAHIYAMKAHGVPARAIHILFTNGLGASHDIPYGEWEHREQSAPAANLTDGARPEFHAGWDFSHLGVVAFDGVAGELVGRQRAFLKCLVDAAGGYVDYATLRRNVWSGYRTEDGNIYKTAGRVRKWIHHTLGIPDTHDPIPARGKSYRLHMP